MGLEIRLGGLPIIVPDALLDRMTGKLERKVSKMLVDILPKGSMLRQTIKTLLPVAMPKIRDWMAKHEPGYPLPDPPRHCDMVTYLTDYLFDYLRYSLVQMRREIEAVPWEVQVVETRAGVQVAGFTPLDTSNPRAIAAPGDGAGSGDAASDAGSTAPAA